jgi:hypothetical protein
MEKYLIHSNDLHLIDARKIHHVLGIKEDRYEFAEDFGIK